MRAKAIMVLLLLTAISSTGQAQTAEELELIYSDRIEFIYSTLQDTTFVVGSVLFHTATGTIYCDSAIWAKGESVILRGNVVVDDEEYRLVADSVWYNLLEDRSLATGDYVELWSKPDSLFAVGTHAFVDRQNHYFYMQQRPTLFINYPDSANLIEVIADLIEYDPDLSRAEATGNVRISSDEFNSSSGCAVMHSETKVLDLHDDPKLVRNQSSLSGELISIKTDDNVLSQIDVVGSAYAEFVEPSGYSDTLLDRSILSGDRIILDFEYGALASVGCRGQAYSWYYPVAAPGSDLIENAVSGDSIRFTVRANELKRVDVVGGAIGSYLSSTTLVEDSVEVLVTDTVNYEASEIKFDLGDSVITLRSGAEAVSGTMSLEAHLIEFDTRSKIIEAFSGDIDQDSLTYFNIFADLLQPNEIPVVLKDGPERLLGDYLEYSLDTKKGRILTSKSGYETGYFYGEKLYRQSEKVFYLDGGRYTTCDADEPHFHFTSRKLKLIDGKRLIARPVVLSIGRLPILAIPYYVFPLEKGRHSGFLPFTIGNIEQGERFIRNVGYYWAASEYWDAQGALDYFEERNRLNFYGKMTYRQLYAFDGSVTANFGRESSVNAFTGIESSASRWTVAAAHNHEFTPSFKISASGQLQSDAQYFNDFSTDLDKRLNRVIRSQVNFTKRFGRSVSLSGKLSHDDRLDDESRTDQLPTLALSLPAIRPFGSGSRDESGQLKQSWYHQFVATYRPNLINSSTRVTVDSIENQMFDTTIQIDTSIVLIDTMNMIEDTTITEDTTIVLRSQDTLSFRSRKEFTRVDHSLRLNFPTKLFRYVTFNPSINYAENWFKIYETDQSINAGIDASQFYRAYRYDVGASMSTKLYGTAYPNVLGLVGLRQVLTPTVAYTFVPEIDRHPEISTFAGGSARSTRRSQRMSFSFNQLYQAKVRQGEGERDLELVSITSSFSYDFEAEGRKLSNMATSYRSSVLPNLNFYGDLRHNFYPDDDSDTPDFLNARLEEIRFNATFNIRGSNFILYESSSAIPRGVDSAQDLTNRPLQSAARGASGSWGLNASYGYSETGRNTNFFRKKSFIRLSLNFNLTRNTHVSYSQYYDFADKKTINNQVVFTRKLHCWTGTFNWVPTGSNRGWGFRLFVTALPDIKIDNSESPISSDVFTDFR